MAETAVSTSLNEINDLFETSTYVSNSVKPCFQFDGELANLLGVKMRM